VRLVLALIVSLTLPQFAQASTDNFSRAKIRLADAASQACTANCDNQNAACKRVCPTTLGAPCFATCDSQAQVCRQSCQPR
jgi:hypothetical protein